MPVEKDPVHHPGQVACLQDRKETGPQSQTYAKGQEKTHRPGFTQQSFIHHFLHPLS